MGITDNAYSAGEIRQMELRILNTLGFNFSRPLPLHFLRRNSKAGDVDVQQHTLAKYLIEISLLEYELVHIPPSLMASAALFLSLRVLDSSLTMATTWSPTSSTTPPTRPQSSSLSSASWLGLLPGGRRASCRPSTPSTTTRGS